MKKNRFLKLFLLVLLVGCTAVFTISCDGGSSNGESTPGEIDNPTLDPDPIITFDSVNTVGDNVTATINAIDFNFILAKTSSDEVTIPLGTFDGTNVTDNSTGKISNPFFLAETELTYELWSEVYKWATGDLNMDGDTTDAGETPGLYTIINKGLQGFTNGSSAPTGNSQHPVTKMSWRDSVVWCNALTEYYNQMNSTNLKCVYYSDAGYTQPIRISNANASVSSTPGSVDVPYIMSTGSGNTDITQCTAKGFRLPTYIEWQYAARYQGSNSTNAVTSAGGTDFKNPTNGLYWTPGNHPSGAPNDWNVGTEYNLYAVAGANTVTTAEVGSKLPNALGIYDMSGNVSEHIYTFNGTKRYIISCLSNADKRYTQIGYSSSYIPNLASGMGIRLAKSK